MEQKKPWVCTDPDTNQYGRQLRKMVYQFKQPDINEGEPVAVYLGRYSNQQIEDNINSYGYTLEEDKNGNTNIHKLYGDHMWWIIAECLFEMEEHPKL